jgi:hypothetical protein
MYYHNIYHIKSIFILGMADGGNHIQLGFIEVIEKAKRMSIEMPSDIYITILMYYTFGHLKCRY